MKKYLYIALAAAALTSCSQDETLEMNQEAISFGKAFVDNATRAASDPSYSPQGQSLTAFNVWGTVRNAASGSTAVTIFANDNVSGTVGTGQVWNSNKTQYWIPTAKYNFAAVVNANAVTLGADLLPTTIDYIADGTTDLLYDKSDEYTGKTSNNDLVKFEFAHLLSKVNIAAINTTTDTDYTYALTGIKITQTPASGTYYINAATVDGTSIAANSWVASSTMEELSFGDISNVTYVATSQTTTYECNQEKLLIPYNYPETSKLTITFNLNWYYKGTQISSELKSVQAAINLAAGTAYRFNISAGLTETIKFTVEENPAWADGGTTNVTVQ